jgi:hypothetical protein
MFGAEDPCDRLWRLMTLLVFSDQTLAPNRSAARGGGDDQGAQDSSHDPGPYRS